MHHRARTITLDLCCPQDRNAEELRNLSVKAVQDLVKEKEKANEFKDESKKSLEEKKEQKLQ